MVDTIQAADTIVELNMEELEDVNGGCYEPWETPPPIPCDES